MEEILIKISGFFALASLLFFFFSIVNGLFFMVSFLIYVGKLKKLQCLDTDSFMEKEKEFFEKVDKDFDNFVKTLLGFALFYTVLFIFEYFVL